MMNMAIPQYSLLDCTSTNILFDSPVSIVYTLIQRIYIIFKAAQLPPFCHLRFKINLLSHVSESCRLIPKYFIVKVDPFYSRGLYPWERFHNAISQFELYSDNDSNVDAVLHDLATQPIVDCSKFNFTIV